MTAKEFSDRFDVLYNNIMSDRAPGLDDREKSVFLNKAQLEVLKNHLNPRGNRYGEGFDGSSKRQIDFSGLTKQLKLENTGTATFCKNASRFDFDEDNDMDTILSILNEYGVAGTRMFTGVPINNVEYDTLMSRPYKLPPKSQCWRMIVDGHFEVVSEAGNTMNEYHIRYVKKPSEFDLDSGYISDVPEILHDEVLQRAIEIAKNAWEGNSQTTVELGGRSE